MRETRTFEIGDCKYKVTGLGAKKALKVLHILSKVSAPVVGGAGVDSDIGEALGKALDRLTEDDLDTVIETMAKETMVVDRPDSGGVALNLSDIFDDHFAGKRLGDMLKWLVECLKLNFSDFLGGLASQYQDLENLAKAGQNSPKD